MKKKFFIAVVRYLFLCLGGCGSNFDGNETKVSESGVKYRVWEMLPFRQNMTSIIGAVQNCRRIDFERR